MKAGVAISPKTPSAAITDEIGHASDLLLVMTVEPGALLPIPTTLTTQNLTSTLLFSSFS